MSNKRTVPFLTANFEISYLDLLLDRANRQSSGGQSSVLDRANNDFDLLIHESLLILRDRPSLNSQQSSIPLALF